MEATVVLKAQQIKTAIFLNNSLYEKLVVSLFELNCFFTVPLKFCQPKIKKAISSRIEWT